MKGRRSEEHMKYRKDRRNGKERKKKKRERI